MMIVYIFQAKNTEFVADFLMKWAAWEWMQPSNFNGADNGVLHAHLMKTLMPEAGEEFENCNAIWHKAIDYDSYMAFVLCIRIYLGTQHISPFSEFRQKIIIFDYSLLTRFVASVPDSI